MSELEHRLRKIEISLEWMSNQDNITAHEIDKLIDKVEALDSEVRHLMAKDQAPMEAQPDSDGWIPWQGGECPVPYYMKVDVRLEEEGERYSVTAGRFAWGDTPGVDRIKAYRPAKQEGEPEWPQKNDIYYHLSSLGNVYSASWTPDGMDKARRDFLGIYPAREQAEEAAGKIKRVMEHWRKGEAVVLATDARLVTAEKLWLDQH